MSGHNDRRHGGFLQSLGLPATYYSDGDGRRSRGTEMEDKLRERSKRMPSRNRSSDPHQDRVSHARKPSASPDRRTSSSMRESSPPHPIYRRRSTQVNETQGNHPKMLGVPDVYLIPPGQSCDRDEKDMLVRGRAPSNHGTPELAESQGARTASWIFTLPDSTVGIGSYGVYETERSGLSMPRSHLVDGLRRPVSADASRRLSPGVLGANAYRYEPLEAKEIRIVRVLAARSSQVKCEILHRPFGNPPDYTAISYAWGDPSDTIKIRVRNEHHPMFVEISISKSLYYALEALRRKGEDVLVWADALSIDQQNPDEKTQQLSLMADIYKKAHYVAVWLGPEVDDSDLATALLQDVAAAAQTDADLVAVKGIFSKAQDRSLPALAALFEREYWDRLWIVQEIFNAASIYVYCGSSQPLPWDVYRTASRVFRKYRRGLEAFLPKYHNIRSRKQYSYFQTLACSGPGNLPDLDSVVSLGDKALLAVLRVCRRKLSSDPKDKVFGILGILGKEVREALVVDYEKSVKEVFTDVVDFLLTTTDHLDVICEAFHFPIYVSSANLPTWVPDWAHIPAVRAISFFPGTHFAASGDTKVEFKFLGERRNQLEIAAIPLGSISWHGIAMGTLCTIGDYLMAFLNWRALLLWDRVPEESENDLALSVQEEFFETICFRQIPPRWKDMGGRAWTEACLHVFACLIEERLPRLAIDDQLAHYAEVDVGLRSAENPGFLDDHFGSRMMGRCFCSISDRYKAVPYSSSARLMGLGTGFMIPNDEVVVPLGCSTPILLRPEGTRGEYRFVGDIYVNGYMHGKAIEDLNSNKRGLKRYIIH